MNANRRRSLLIGTAAGLVAALAAVGAAAAVDAIGNDTPARTVDADLHFTPADQDPQPLVAGDPRGDPVPTVKYPELAGGLGTLADYKGTPVVLNLFGSYCVPCKKEMPDLQKVHEELGDQVAFVGLAVNDSDRDVRAFVKRYGATYDIGRDPSGKIASALGVINMPSTFLIGADGRIKSAKAGAVTAAELRKLIEGNLTSP
ncbi:MAG: thiol-disulfide oxidoreductase [Actinomycetia bacterium]|nr:thiol-disulfide oxidoreductase [Actinomycetes bacterium]